MKDWLVGRRAFTLVEVLTVVVIVGLLTALAGAGVSRALVGARQAKCLSNQRQIGMALLLYAQENEGRLPVTTHTTGSFRKEESWIYQLAPYLDHLDEVRICPAEPPARQQRIRQMKATSYVLNDLVCDHPEHNHLLRLPLPGQTMILFTLSENRAPSVTRDHIHGAEWKSWGAALNDIEPDRHRLGRRDASRLKGSANYLFADGHVENIPAVRMKSYFDRGINPAEVPHP